MRLTQTLTIGCKKPFTIMCMGGGGGKSEH